MQINQDTHQDQHLNITEGPMAKHGAVMIQDLPLNKIKLAKNSRLNVTDSEIAGLMQSIKKVGLLQPIGVMKNGSGYEICYGNRRFLAASKLGYTSIPAVVHNKKEETDADLKNLTENIQRRNISLPEAGRYMSLLHKEKLSYAEIAIRLGVSRTYVESCLRAYSEVPKEFQKDLDVRVTGDKTKTPGKIAITVANAIGVARRKYQLDPNQVKSLFQAAKSDDRFALENVGKYAAAMKDGKKDFVGAAPKLCHIQHQFWISQTTKDALERKFVEGGPFKSLSGLFSAILKGEKSYKIDIV